MRMLICTAGLFAVIGLGCKGDGMVPVKGKVTLDGVPVDGGGIQFQPLDGSGPTAGAVITNGEYSTMVPAGKARVEIRASKLVGKRKGFEGSSSPEADDFAESIPARYNTQSTLTADIVSGMGPLDFDLKSSAK